MALVANDVRVNGIRLGMLLEESDRARAARIAVVLLERGQHHLNVQRDLLAFLQAQNGEQWLQPQRRGK